MLHRQLGGMQIDRIIESESPDFDPLAFFPDTTPEDWAPYKPWLEPWCLDPKSGNIVLPM